MKPASKTCIITLLSLFLLCLFSVSGQAQNTGVSGDNTINRCETKTYSVSVQNNSGNTLNYIVITAQLGNLTGFSYEPGTASIEVDGGGAFCTADPVENGTDLEWNIDSLCPSTPFSLNDGETLTVTFNLTTDCSAVSGSLNTLIDYEIEGTPFSDNTGVANIQVNPGAVTIRKTPEVVARQVGQTVDWTLTVENTGFGVIENVEVTDQLGSGLSYVSSSPVGDVTGSGGGETVVWTSNEIPALASMNPGDIITIDITATVIACTGLDNTADVRFGCEPSPGEECFNTATDGGTAEASVQRIVKTPLIDFTAPDISFTYCQDTANISMTIGNTGDGTAYNVYNIVDFGDLAVSNVSAGATYNPSENRFELTDPIAPGGSYELSFDLTFSDWCSGTFPSGDLVWTKLYQDGCGNDFYPPVVLSTINEVAALPSLSVSKSGAPSQIQIGGTMTYDIVSSYSGPTSCGSGNAALVTVVDTLPDGLTVTDAGGGVWVPGGGGRGGTITWTYDPEVGLNTSVTVQIPDASQCEAYCNTVITNSVTATGTDCCGCSLTDTDTLTTAIECEEGVTSEKTYSSQEERCSDTTYTNTYTFNQSIMLNTLVFTEQAEFQQLYNHNLSVELDGNDITGNVTVIDNTSGGGTLVLDFSGLSATDLNGSTLIISYNLTATENTLDACGSRSFYSWSSLDVGASGSSCLADGVIHETTQVSLYTPAMDISVTGLDDLVHKCETHEILVTVSQSNDYNPQNVTVELSGLSYYIVNAGNPASFTYGGSHSPINTTPTIDGDGDYIWNYEDLFTGNGQTATIRMTVQKRCTGPGELVATVHYQDACEIETCSNTGSDSPVILLNGDLIIEKNPETYYATENTAEWKIYVTNRGDGSAYNVWIDDILGSGMLFNSASVDDMTGVTISSNLDHDGAAINGASIQIGEISSGIRREITFTADVIDCNNLTNDVTASWGCDDIDCQTIISDSSTVNVPAPNLVHTNTISPSGGIEACSSPTGSISLRNAGQVTCYNLQIVESLPSGLSYVSGSTRWRVNSGAWNGPNVAYDPNPTTSPLQWTNSEILALSSISPGDTVTIEYDLEADCEFTGGNTTLSSSYENPCADVFTNADSVFTVRVNDPDIQVAKTRADEPVDCGEAVSWTISITNNSGYTLPIVWVEDTLDGFYTPDSSAGDGTYSVDNGTINGQTISWELTNVPHGTTVDLTLNATTDTNPCSSQMDNTVTAWWGCGVTDGSSNTKPGEDSPDDSLCLNSTGVSYVRQETREPSVDFQGTIGLSPAVIDSCNDSTELTVTIANAGTTDASDLDLVITLPANLTYNSGTAELCVGTDGSCVTSSIGDPSISSNTLTFYDINSTGSDLVETLQGAGGNDTLVLKFTVQTDCYTTSDIDFDVYFYDCCGDSRYSQSTSLSLTAQYPELTITKVPQGDPAGCNEDQEWLITVANTGDGDAQVVLVQDMMGDWIQYVSSSSSVGTATDLGSGVYGWEFNNLVSGASQTFTITGRLVPATRNTCASNVRTNSARTRWACGSSGDAIDGDPSTTGYDCSDSSWVNATADVVEIPNLEITALGPEVTCSDDGVFSGSVRVTVRNAGDGATDTGFTVQVADGKGWTGTGTYSGILAAGGSTNISIDTTGWSPDCQSCSSTYSFSATVDLGDVVCECDETDNTYGPASYTVPIPDLTVTDIDFSTVTCSSDGISGSVRVQVENLGCVSASGVRVDLETDGCLTFTPSTGNTVAGQSSTWITFNISGDLADCTDQNCDFTAIVDQPGTVCECDGTNNERTETWTNTLPDLVVTNIDTSGITCLNDSISGSVSVTVQNQGYGSATGFEVALSSDCGISFSEVTVNDTLQNGDSKTVTLNVSGSWSSCDDCSCDLTATVDPNGDVCECNGSNNELSGSYTSTLPNLRVRSVTPTCVDDGEFSIEVVVDNNGCGDASSFDVRLEDSDGRNDSQTISLAQGAQTTLTFSSWSVNAAATDLDFTATIDYSNSVCECSAGDNTGTASLQTPNLTVSAITPACVDDDSYQISVGINNAGDAAITNNFDVRLSDNDGKTSTQSFTALGGTLPLGVGATQTVTFSNWNVDGDPVSLTFTANLDVNDAICESASSDNTDSTSVDLTDLEISTISPGATCVSDGTIQGEIEVALRNSGAATISDDFRISVDDGEGWTDELWYNADLGGTLPLGAGASATVTITWNCSFTGTPFTCDFTSIAVTVDSQDDICEVTASNNSSTTSYSQPFPNLRVVSITPSCIDDSTYSIDVVVHNNGCEDATGVVVQLADDDGLSDTRTVNLSAGAQTTVTFSPWSADGTPVNLTFTATIDPSDAVCELDGSDNGDSETIQRPNLSFVSITPACVDDDSYQISLVIENDGGDPAGTDFDIRLSDNDGNTVTSSFTTLGGTLPINSGTQQTVTFSNWPVDGNPTTLSFTAEIDVNDALCETLSADNTISTTDDLTDLLLTSITPAATCRDDGTIQGEIDVELENIGATTIADDFRISVDDGEGWTAELWYNADLGGTLPLNSGASETVTFTWNRAFTATPYTCDFTGINAVLDSQSDICEVTASNNTDTVSYSLSMPDLIADTISTTVTCLSDSDVTGTTVTVRNDGCADVTDAVVRLSSDCGLTFSDQTVSVAAGASEDVFFPFTSGITNCSCNFIVLIDPDNSICELDGTNNSATSTAGMLIPDIEVIADTLDISCVDDGVIGVSGSVTVQNNGCGPNLVDDIPVRLTLFDQSGCTGTELDVWTLTLTGVNIISAGGTQTFNIDQHQITIDICEASQDCNVSVFVELDYSNQICEWDGSDNTYCVDIISDCLDVAVTSLIPQVRCETASGTVSGSLAFTIENTGSESIDRDFYVTIDDSRGWRRELQYSADLGGPLPLASGETAQLSIGWRREFDDDNCSFPAINISIDTRDEYCQCTIENDTLTVPYTVDYPGLLPTAIVPECDVDGFYRIAVTVENHSCADSGTFEVSLADNRGNRQVREVSNLGEDESTEVIFDAWPVGCDVENLTFTATVDPETKVCDLIRSDNQITTQYAVNSVNLVAGAVNWSCNDDGSFQLDVTVRNDGDTNTDGARATIYDEQGQVVDTRSLRIAADSSISFTVTTGTYQAGEQHQFRLVVDEADAVCECDGSDNELVIEATCDFVGEPHLVVTKTCPTGQLVDEFYTFEIVILNDGDADATDVQVVDILPDGFNYVDGSSLLDGQLISDPVDNGALTWSVGYLAVDDQRILTFSALPTADIQAGRYCNEAFAETADGSERSETVECCTIVTRPGGQTAGCCIEIEAELLGAWTIPPVVLAIPELRFETRSAMQAVYASLNLWQQGDLQEDTYPWLVRQRLVDYALSTMREYYLNSESGVIDDDNMLRFSFAESDPVLRDEQLKSWRERERHELMTPGQLGYEILALWQSSQFVEQPALKQHLQGLMQQRLTFLTEQIEELPQQWNLNGDAVESSSEEASTSELISLLLSLSLINDDSAQLTILTDSLMEQLAEIRDRQVTFENVYDEILFAESLQIRDENDLYRQKVDQIMTLLAGKDPQFISMRDHIRTTGFCLSRDTELGMWYWQLLKENYLHRNIQLFGETESDGALRVKLSDVGELIKLANFLPANEREHVAMILDRHFDNGALFTKPHLELPNLVVGSGDEPTVVPHQSEATGRTLDTAEVFVKEARILPPGYQPLPVSSMGRNWLHLLGDSINYETGDLAVNAAELMRRGRLLMAEDDPVRRELGRRFLYIGRRFTEALISSGAGASTEKGLLIPAPELALQGINDTALMKENARDIYSLDDLADMLWAETEYLNQGGHQQERLRMLQQQRFTWLLALSGLPFTPAEILLNRDSQTVVGAAGSSAASDITLAKLAQFIPDSRQYFLNQTSGEEQQLGVDDLLFLNAYPQWVDRFEVSLSALADSDDSDSLSIQKRLMAQRLLGEASYQENTDWWDSRKYIPTAQAGVEGAGKDLRYYELNQLLMLSNLSDGTKNEYQSVIHSLLRDLLQKPSTLTVNGAQIKVPAKRYWLTIPAEAQQPQPGDQVAYRVTVDTLCPDGSTTADSYGSYYVRGRFNRYLEDLGSHGDEGLQDIGDFQWRYEGELQNGKFSFIGYAQLPSFDVTGMLSGEFHVSSQNLSDNLWFDESRKDLCEDITQVQGIRVEPYAERLAVVFADRNGNGIKEAGGEQGLQGVVFKDELGRIYHSDADGYIRYDQGATPRYLQMQIESIPQGYLATDYVSQWVRVDDERETGFPLVPVRKITGIVYRDANGNGRLDSDEKGVANVRISAGEHATFTDAQGQFELFNVPLFLEEALKISDAQPLIVQLPDDLVVKIDSQEE